MTKKQSAEARDPVESLPPLPDAPLSRSSDIMVVGGYGQVGMYIATQLAGHQPNHVVVAGRDGEKAERAAAAIGHGTRGRAIDISMALDPAKLQGVGLVVVCVDQEDTTFVETCLARGIDYVDVSAQFAFLARVEELNTLALENGATVVLSVGVEPGLSNLLAARAGEGLDRIQRLDIFLELGLGDRHGAAAVAWMLDNLDAEYEVQEDGVPRTVRSLSEARAFPEVDGGAGRAAYRFNFPDQQVLARTLDVPTVSTWMRFSSGAMTWLAARGARLGLGHLLRISWLRRIAIWLTTKVHLGSDRCRVVVRATGELDGGATDVVVGVSGRHEALMTATVAADTVRQIIGMDIAPGVFHSEQVIDLLSVVNALKREVPGLTVELGANTQDRPSPATGEHDWNRA